MVFGWPEEVEYHDNRLTRNDIVAYDRRRTNLKKTVREQVRAKEKAAYKETSLTNAIARETEAKMDMLKFLRHYDGNHPQLCKWAYQTQKSKSWVPTSRELVSFRSVIRRISRSDPSIYNPGTTESIDLDIDPRPSSLD